MHPEALKPSPPPPPQPVSDYTTPSLNRGISFYILVRIKFRQLKVYSQHIQGRSLPELALDAWTLSYMFSSNFSERTSPYHLVPRTTECTDD